MPTVVRTAPRSIWGASCPSSYCCSAGGTSAIYLHARRKADSTSASARSLNLALHSPLFSTNPAGSQEMCSVVKHFVVCGSRGYGGRGSRVARADKASAYRSLVTPPIKQLPRQRGEARKGGAAAGHRIATNHDP